MIGFRSDRLITLIEVIVKDPRGKIFRGPIFFRLYIGFSLFHSLYHCVISKMWDILCIVNLRNKPRNSHLRFTTSCLGNGELCYEYFFPVIHPIIPKLRYFSANRAPFPQPFLSRSEGGYFFRQHADHNDDRVQSNTDANRKHNDGIFDIFLCFFTLATTGSGQSFLSSHQKQVRVVFLLKAVLCFFCFRLTQTLEQSFRAKFR